MTVTGSLDGDFSLRVLNADGRRPESTSPARCPNRWATTGGADETLEGLRVTLSGVVTEAPSGLSDGLGLMVDDGTGPLRDRRAGRARGATVATGDVDHATGPLGQRDSSGTGLAGYRVHATLAGELVVAPLPTPPDPDAERRADADAARPTTTPSPSRPPCPPRRRRQPDAAPRRRPSDADPDRSPDTDPARRDDRRGRRLVPDRSGASRSAAS